MNANYFDGHKTTQMIQPTHVHCSQHMKATGSSAFITHTTVTVRLNTWYHCWQYKNSIDWPYQRVSEVMLHMYLFPVDDWECWLCSGSPPPAGSEAKESPSWGALRVSAGQRGPPPSWQKVSSGSSWEKWQKAGGQRRRQRRVGKHCEFVIWIQQFTWAVKYIYIYIYKLTVILLIWRCRK